MKDTQFSYNRQQNLFEYFLKEILCFRKSRNTHEDLGEESSKIKFNRAKSETTVTTKTFINEQIFIETEFLPTRPHRQRSIHVSQVNIFA